MRYLGSLLLVCLCCLSCSNPGQGSLTEGYWLARLEVQDGEVLPFNFNLKKDNGQYALEIYNADEVIKVHEVKVKNDSIVIQMPVFEGYIKGKYNDTVINGEFIIESLNRVVPFSATYGERTRFKTQQEPLVNVSGIWKTEFSPDTPNGYLGKGIFTQDGSKVTGTFRTTTGDYRFLEGVMDGDTMKISAFDGSHAFLFTAKVSDSTLEGTFYSGNHYQEPFFARRNEYFELPDPDSLTYLKPGHEKLAFTFPDTEGNPVSLEDDQFKNKAVIVQIMGTWCPNCLDETKFLVNYQEENPQLDVAIVALAFEYSKTEEQALQRIDRLKDAIGVQYPILLAQYGSSSKIEAHRKLPMLNHIISYPTTIFVDKKGAVRKISTGFNGPATGEKYESFKKDFDAFVKQLASE